jgi:hypothetical protein
VTAFHRNALVSDRTRRFAAETSWFPSGAAAIGIKVLGSLQEGGGFRQEGTTSREKVSVSPGNASVSAGRLRYFAERSRFPSGGVGFARKHGGSCCKGLEILHKTIRSRMKVARIFRKVAVSLRKVVVFGGKVIAIDIKCLVFCGSKGFSRKTLKKPGGILDRTKRFSSTGSRNSL